MAMKVDPIWRYAIYLSDKQILMIYLIEIIIILTDVEKFLAFCWHHFYPGQILSCEADSLANAYSTLERLHMVGTDFRFNHRHDDWFQLYCVFNIQLLPRQFKSDCICYLAFLQKLSRVSLTTHPAPVWLHGDSIFHQRMSTFPDASTGKFWPLPATSCDDDRSAFLPEKILWRISVILSKANCFPFVKGATSTLLMLKQGLYIIFIRALSKRDGSRALSEKICK